ncbi:hypothetical protein [Streptomyces globisporus]|uniref:hypothetical protein n=1 Tax=Streptomyces globisporus TaxID=1908 RepID=UPI003460E367
MSKSPPPGSRRKCRTRALRHASISLWIKSGMDPVEAAYRAGRSLAVLYRFYAELLKGGSAAANRLVELGLRAEE